MFSTWVPRQKSKQMFIHNFDISHWFYHGWYGRVVQAVIKPIAKVTRKTNFDSLWLRNPWSDFNETWNTYQCHGYDHTCRSTWRCDNVGGRTQKTRDMSPVRFLSIPFLIYFALAPSPHQWSDFDDLGYTSYDVFPRKEMPFGASFILLPTSGVKLEMCGNGFLHSHSRPFPCNQFPFPSIPIPIPISVIIPIPIPFP